MKLENLFEYFLTNRVQLMQLRKKTSMSEDEWSNRGDYFECVNFYKGFKFKFYQSVHSSNDTSVTSGQRPGLLCFVFLKIDHLLSRYIFKKYGYIGCLLIKLF